jgi:hypothetical protein
VTEPEIGRSRRPRTEKPKVAIQTQRRPFRRKNSHASTNTG